MKTNYTSIEPSKLIRIQLDMPANSLDPLTVSDTITREILDNVYERLFQYQGFELHQCLVKELYISEAKKYRIILHKNVLFHDGTILDSNIVKRCIVRMIKMSKRAKYFLENILDEDGIQCLSKYNIQFSLKKSFSEFPHILAIQEATIMPKCLLDNLEKTSREAIGTGPFVLASIDRINERVKMINNERYWGQKAFLSEVEIIVRKDYQQRKKMLTQGRADIIEVQASKIEDLSKQSGIVFDTFPSLDISLFIFNCKKGPMSDTEIRSEIKELFDYDLCLKKARKGLGSRIYSAVPGGLDGHISNIEAKMFNRIEKVDNRFYSTKIKDKIKILTIEGLEDAKIAVSMLGKCLKSIELQYEIVSLPFREYSNEQDKGNYDISFLSWAPDVVSSFAYLYDFYHSKGEVSKIVGLKNNIIDGKIDDLRNNIIQSNSDGIKQIEKIGEMYNSYMWLYQAKSLKVHSNKVYGVSHNVLDGDYSFRTIKKVEENENYQNYRC